MCRGAVLSDHRTRPAAILPPCPRQCAKSQAPSAPTGCTTALRMNGFQSITASECSLAEEVQGRVGRASGGRKPGASWSPCCLAAAAGTGNVKAPGTSGRSIESPTNSLLAEAQNIASATVFDRAGLPSSQAVPVPHSYSERACWQAARLRPPGPRARHHKPFCCSRFCHRESKHHAGRALVYLRHLPRVQLPATERHGTAITSINKWACKRDPLDIETAPNLKIAILGIKKN